MSYPRSLALLVGLAASAVSTTAFGAPTAQDKVLGDTLFRDARALMEAKDYPAACAKFAASQTYDPQLGTLLNLALCHEAEGKTASAWAEFDDAANEATQLAQPGRVTFAREHKQALDPKLTRLRVVVSDSAPTDLMVKVDGVPLARSAWGSAAAFDPGVHSIDASALNKNTNTQMINLPNEAIVTNVTIPVLADAPVPVATATPLTSVIAPPEKHGGSSRKTAACVIGAVGVVGLGVGAGFGVATISNKNAANSGHCGPTSCDSTGIDDLNAAHTDATVSTAAFVTGIAAAAVAVVMYVTAPKDDDANDARKINVAPWLADRRGPITSFAW